MNVIDVQVVRQIVRGEVGEGAEQSESQPAQALRGLLELEDSSLIANARINPVTKALSNALSRGNQQSSVVVISSHEHDAEALAFNSYALSLKGTTVINV